jgi:hypothetical protein
VPGARWVWSYGETDEEEVFHAAQMILGRIVNPMLGFSRSGQQTNKLEGSGGSLGRNDTSMV